MSTIVPTLPPRSRLQLLALATAVALVLLAMTGALLRATVCIRPPVLAT